MSNTNKSSSITSDNPDAQRREQQIFLRKFNEDFVKYKNILTEKLTGLREKRLKDLINTEKPIADNKTDYERHLTRKKHMIKHNLINNIQASKSNTYVCPSCYKSFKCRTSIYKHKAICKSANTSTTSSTSTSATSSSEQNLCEVLAKNFTNAMLMLFQQNTEFQSKMIELCKTGGTTQSHNTNSLNTTNNNQQYSLNFFLNEQCKDAMNMKDFVNSIQLNLTDLENVGRLGYVEGMSNILIDNLQKTDIYKRPVHCSDVKRETLYVKDDNKWEREGPNHQKMVNAVLAVEHKNVALVNEWAKAHPLCMNSNSRDNETYMKLSKTVTDGEKEGNIQKVIRKVSKKVAVEKDGTSVTA